MSDKLKVRIMASETITYEKEVEMTQEQLDAMTQRIQEVEEVDHGEIWIDPNKDFTTGEISVWDVYIDVQSEDGHWESALI